MSKTSGALVFSARVPFALFDTDSFCSFPLCPIFAHISAGSDERALERYGNRVRLWFSDEDGDLYRFMQDTAKHWWQV